MVKYLDSNRIPCRNFAPPRCQALGCAVFCRRCAGKTLKGTAQILYPNPAVLNPGTYRVLGNAHRLRPSSADGDDVRMHVQDAWDWMVPHWCDRSESIWPVEQIDNPKLDLNRPQEFVAAVYTHVMKSVEVADAYTLRGRHYALLYQSMRGGPDPKHEMDEARVRPPPPRGQNPPQPHCHSAAHL